METQTKKPDPATEGQFRDFLARLIQRQPEILSLLEKKGMQKLNSDPQRFIHEFAEFVNHAGVVDNAHLINCVNPSPIGLHGDYHHSQFSSHENIIWGDGKKIQLLPISDFKREPFFAPGSLEINQGDYFLDFKKIHDHLRSLGKVLVNANVFLYLRQRRYLAPMDSGWKGKIIVFLGSRFKKDDSDLVDEKCAFINTDYSETLSNFGWGSFHYGKCNIEGSLGHAGRGWSEPGKCYIAVL